MSTFQAITAQDDPLALAEVAKKHQTLLTEALNLAKQSAEGKPQLVREILATCTVEGLDAKLGSKAAAVNFRAERYKRTWHTLIPWQDFEYTTAEEEAESMIQSIEDYIEMTETNSWPQLPAESE